MPAHFEEPASIQVPRAEMRIVVKGTFIEVVEEGDSQLPETAVRRALSAPVLSRRREEEADCFDSPVDLAQQSQVVEGQVGQEPKTTVAIRNIPFCFTRDQVQQRLDAGGFAGQYDFLYLPIDFARCRNFGHAFVNLTSSENAQRIFAEFGGLSWGDSGDGQLVVSQSLTQGLDEHVERYRNSPLMHESMLDDCRPILLRGGVRVDFPPPTAKVHRLRRLRSRCGTGGRSVPSGGFASSMILHGLTSAPGGGASQQDAILASPLLAGLRPAGIEAPKEAAPGQRRERVPEGPLLAGLRLTSTGAPSSSEPLAASNKKAAWADMKDDFDDGCSECSTQAPSSCFGSTVSSDGHGGSSDGTAVRPWLGSMLAQGLMPALPEGLMPALSEERGAQAPWSFPELGSLVEVVGTFPSGGHAVVTAVDRERGTCKLQLMHEGRLTRRARTVKCKFTRPVRREEVRQ